MIYELFTSDNYPNSYWFDFFSKNFNGLEFLKCEKITESSLKRNDIVFMPVSVYNKKISEKNFLKYDFFVSANVPFFISPRFVELLTQLEGIEDDLQLIDITVIVNDVTFHGYKAMNVIKSISCIDMDKSDHEIWYPLGDNNPINSILNFNKIIFKNKIKEEFYIARCDEYMTQVVASEKFKEFAIKNKIKGIGFS